MPKWLPSQFLMWCAFACSYVRAQCVVPPLSSESSTECFKPVVSNETILQILQPTNLFATLQINIHVNECWDVCSDFATRPCCSGAANLILPSGYYLVVLTGGGCSTSNPPCNDFGSPEVGTTPLETMSGICSGPTQCQMIAQENLHGGPYFLNHLGGSFSMWRYDCYSGDNFGFVSASFYSACFGSHDVSVTYSSHVSEGLSAVLLGVVVVLALLVIGLSSLLVIHWVRRRRPTYHKLMTEANNGIGMELTVSSVVESSQSADVPVG